MKTMNLSKADEMALSRMREMFNILNEMGYDMAEGHIKGMIVYGPPGVGKSYGIIKAFEDASFERCLSDNPLEISVKTGFMTPVHLYKALWENKDPDQIVVFDDCDNILNDADSLNMLKAALDTTGERIISYNAESHMLRYEGIDSSFSFKGSIVFITNIDFDNARGKIHDHLQAIISRCHYLDLTINTKRDKFLWMREVALNKGMLAKKGIPEDQAHEIIDFIEENINDMRELSLRMVLKIADLRLSSEGEYSWQQKARVSCMKQSKSAMVEMV